MIVSRIWAAVILAAGAESIANGEPVSFQHDIAPLLQRRCAACHAEDSAKGRYRLDTFARLKKAGDSDLAPIVAGKPQESELARLLHEPSSEDRMPQKADSLPDAEIALIERWISEGANYDGGSPSRTLAELARATMLRPGPEHYGRPVPITALAASPDGTRLAVSGYYEVTIWNIADGTLVTRIGGMPERITSICWHPQLPLLAVAGGTPMQWGTVALVDPMNLRPVQYLCDMPDTALSAVFSPDGSRLAMAGADRSLRIFDPISGRARKLLKLHADWVQTVTFDKEGNRLLTTSRDRTARVIDAGSGEVLASYTGHDTPLLGGIFVEDGKRAWTFARSGEFHRWNVENAERKTELKMYPAALLATRRGMLEIGQDRKIRRYDGEKLEDTWNGTDAYPTSAVLVPGGERFAIGCADGTVSLFLVAGGTQERRVTVFVR